MTESEEAPTAAESYFSSEDRKRFLEVEEAARLLVEKIEEELDASPQR